MKELISIINAVYAISVFFFFMDVLPSIFSLIDLLSFCRLECIHTFNCHYERGKKYKQGHNDKYATYKAPSKKEA
jgi:hypothetical protein